MIDARRVIDASQGDVEKADALIEQISSMTKYEKIRAVEFGKANPKATVEQVIEKGQIPKFEETVILNLPSHVSKALKTASEKLTKGSEEIIMDALTEWLMTNDFLALQRL